MMEKKAAGEEARAGGNGSRAAAPWAARAGVAVGGGAPHGGPRLAAGGSRDVSELGSGHVRRRRGDFRVSGEKGIRISGGSIYRHRGS